MQSEREAGHPHRRARVLGIWVLIAGIIALSVPAAAEPPLGPASGLPVPRFVSLKSDRVNVRAGPSKDHDVVWVYMRAGLPVEITAEFENWRRIRDWEGAEGWVYHTMLSGRRTALVAPQTKSQTDLLPMYERAGGEAPVAAKLQPGVLGSVKRCSEGWCRMTGERFDGWIEQPRLWGVYPNEKLE